VSKSRGQARAHETDLNSVTTGIPGTRADVDEMLARDGKVLDGSSKTRYATGRSDGEAPEFPGVGHVSNRVIRR
jgi:hypothetical protein